MNLIKLFIALLVLCLSPVALAKSGEKDQLLVTPPMANGEYYQVLYLNNSEDELPFTIEFFDYDGSSLLVVTLVPAAGHMADINLYLSVTTYNMAYAHLSWFGKKDDLLVTVCSLDALDTPTFKSCVKAN